MKKLATVGSPADPPVAVEKVILLLAQSIPVRTVMRRLWGTVYWKNEESCEARRSRRNDTYWSAASVQERSLHVGCARSPEIFAHWRVSMLPLEKLYDQ
jgi:hypothetical protein